MSEDDGAIVAVRSPAIRREENGSTSPLRNKGP